LSLRETAAAWLGPAAGRDLDLVVIGDCNPDVLVLGADVTPAFGQQEKLVDQVSLEIGGSAAITAVAAARLGLKVALIAAVGRDPAGTFMLDQLAREGVDVSAVIVRDGTPTGMTVALSRGGDRAILTALGAIASLTSADVPHDLLARARHVHVSSYFLLAESLGPGLAATLAAARAAGARTSLDTNWDPSGRWADGHLSAAVAQADLLLPNEAEALALSGAPTAEAAALALAGAGPAVAVKLGERGVLCADQSGMCQVSLPPVTPVDTTGAGDCFNAGLIAGLVQGLPLPGAAALGCAVGALSTGALGGTAGAPGLPAATDAARHAAIREDPR
jgi:sugar/nucleoside kinase (ribokinase family)